MTQELPGMPPKSKIALLFEKYSDETDDINKRRAIRRGTKREIIVAMREAKKGEMSFVINGFRHTFRIIPGDSNLQVTTTALKTKED